MHTNDQQINARIRSAFLDRYHMDGLKAISDLQKEISGKLSKLAGEAFVEGRDEEATQLREAAKIALRDLTELQRRNIFVSPG